MWLARASVFSVYFLARANFSIIPPLGRPRGGKVK